MLVPNPQCCSPPAGLTANEARSYLCPRCRDRYDRQLSNNSFTGEEAMQFAVNDVPSTGEEPLRFGVAKPDDDLAGSRVAKLEQQKMDEEQQRRLGLLPFPGAPAKSFG